MKKIILSKIEYDYLNSVNFLSMDKKNIIFNAIKQIQDSYVLMITEDQADELRDLFGEQLELYGFDENYEPTKDGNTLESLIDKFFRG